LGLSGDVGEDLGGEAEEPLPFGEVGEVVEKL
jgi:hypothetical protein